VSSFLYSRTSASCTCTKCCTCVSTEAAICLCCILQIRLHAQHSQQSAYAVYYRYDCMRSIAAKGSSGYQHCFTHSVSYLCQRMLTSCCIAFTVALHTCSARCCRLRSLLCCSLSNALCVVHCSVYNKLSALHMPRFRSQQQPSCTYFAALQLDDVAAIDGHISEVTGICYCAVTSFIITC
jgi:hypothetical protein